MWWFQSYFHKWSVPVIIGLIIFFFSQAMVMAVFHST